MSEDFPKPEHNTIYKRENQVDGCSPENGEERGRFVEGYY